jgi:hypothetical protein
MNAKTNSDLTETGLSKGRFYTGGTIFVVGFLSPLFVPLVTAAPLPVGWKTTISGLLLVGIPELAMLIAAAVMGKAGFNYLKQLIFGFLGKHFAPPETVSPIRYRIGLILFTVPLLFGWVTPYISGYIPLFEEHHLLFAIFGDLLLFSSLFVLGGEFWDKLRALFIHKAKVNIA